jgi:phage shock protein C
MSSDVKKLYRSTNDRMIGGVCGGLGEYLGIDPTVIRLIYVIIALTGGAGVLIYLIMLLVVPEGSAGNAPSPASSVPEPAPEALTEPTEEEPED